MNYLNIQEVCKILKVNKTYVYRVLKYNIKGLKKCGKTLMFPNPEILRIKKMSSLEFLRFITGLKDAITTKHICEMLHFKSRCIINLYVKDGKLPGYICKYSGYKVYSLNVVLNYLRKGTCYIDDDYINGLKPKTTGLKELNS